MLELYLVAALGFLGSFGHCVGMCGPIAMAFSLSVSQASNSHTDQTTRWQRFCFHLLLNLGRVLSYALVGAAIGSLGSVLVAGGQFAGVGSLLRRAMAWLTGGLLIILGVGRVMPDLWPRGALWHPLRGALHHRLQGLMAAVAAHQQWWTPFLLGLVWGLVPCGFLYAAQIKAAETSSFMVGAATMLAFGLGTLPVMLGLGASSAALSQHRAAQLSQLGGWLTLLIGILTLTRTGDVMVDYTGHLALGSLGLALIARPVSRVWSGLLKFRRLLGVGAFILAMAHTLHMLEHSWGWNVTAVRFMLPQHRWGMVMGAIALISMVPLTLTSTDSARRRLGARWRSLHLLGILAMVLACGHCILAGSTYLGNLRWQGRPLAHSLALGGCLLLLLAIRSRWVWQLWGIERWYVSAKSSACKDPQTRGQLAD